MHAVDLGLGASHSCHGLVRVPHLCKVARGSTLKSHVEACSTKHGFLSGPRMVELRPSGAPRRPQSWGGGKLPQCCRKMLYKVRSCLLILPGGHMDHSESRALLPQEARLEDHHKARRATLHVSRFHYLLAATLCPASDILDAEV